MPIARREMLVLAKSPAMYRGRVATGVVLLVLGIGFGILYERAGLSGTLPFIGIGTGLATFCTFLGASLTADAISRERRDGTLGLLFLTGLSPLQIVGGKLVAHGLAAVFAVFLAFPLACMVLVTAGFPFGDVLRIAIFALNTLFVTACIGIWSSCYNTERKKAASRAVWVVMFFWWMLPMLSQLAAANGAPASMITWMQHFSLTGGMTSMFGPRAMTSWLSWSSVFCNHLTGWFFFAWATLALPRRWQDKPKMKSGGWRGWWKRLSYGNAETRRKLRERLLDLNAFYWLASRDRLRFLAVWLFTITVIGFGWWFSWAQGWRMEPVIACSVALGFVQNLIMCGGGANQLLVEQEQGTLEMLLSTPLNARYILQGQLRAALRHFEVPALLFCLNCLVAWICFNQQFRVFGGWDFRLVMPVALLLYGFCLYTGGWLSMWAAVISRDPKHAPGAAIVRLLVLPAFVFFGGMISLILLQYVTGHTFFPPRKVTLVLCFGLIVFNNFFWLNRVKTHLPERFRTWAFQRYAPEPIGWFGRLGQVFGRKWAGRNRLRPGAVAGFEQI